MRDLEEEPGVAIDQLVSLAICLLENLALEKEQEPDEILKEATMKLLQGE